MFFAWVVGLLVAGAEDVHPADEPLQDSVALEVTQSGMASLGDVAAVLLPSDPMALDPISQSGGFSCLNYEFGLKDGEVNLEIQSAELVAGSNKLLVNVDLMVSINDSANPFVLDYELFCVGEDCPGYVTPFLVEASVPIGLQVITGPDGNPIFDATLSEPTVVNHLSGDNIILDCNIGTLETVLDYFGLSLYDLIISAAEGQIQDAVLDSLGDLEAQLDEALAQVQVHEEFTINEATITLDLEPQEVNITEAVGMELILAGQATAEPAACIANYDGGGSLATPSDLPGLDDLPSGVETAGLIADDFANRLLYAVWRAGVLCYVVDSDADLGVPINTSLLGILGGDAFEELFPEPAEMVIQTDPREPPTLVLDDTHDFVVQAHEIDVNFYGVLDHRMARALGVTIDADVGGDLLFDGETGALDLALDLGADAIAIRVTGNELAPAADQVISEGMTGLMGTLVDTLLGSALEGLSLQLGSMNGLGLTSMTLGAAGAESDWLMASAEIGTVTYGGEGCNSEEGCTGGAEGCDQGCASGRVGMWPIWGIALPLGILVRRRRMV